MTEYQQRPGHDCEGTKNPAAQPHPPGDTCEPLPPSTPPVLEDPKPCPPPEDCYCPTTGKTSNCLEDLIAAQATQITAADKAKAFKTDLEALLGKAKTAAQEYTQTKYADLVKKWVDQDRQIADLLRKLDCALPCWRCIIECHICPLINVMHDAEARLYGDGTLYDKVHNLYDLRYWYERDRDAKQRTFDRIKGVLAAWEKPAQTIDKALADDATLIADASKLVGSDAPRAVVDVFLKLVPMHLAIAPPSGSKWTTLIDKAFTEFCGCDVGYPDDCCGPDVGWQSLRQRLIGPQPYLIDPNDYFKIICCLVENRYGKAKDALAQADAAFQSVDALITRYKNQVENGLKSLEKDAKAAIPSLIDCCKDYKKPEQQQQQSAR